jgi:hypothetical protein
VLDANNVADVPLAALYNCDFFFHLGLSVSERKSNRLSQLLDLLASALLWVLRICSACSRPHHLYILADNFLSFPGSQATSLDIIRPGPPQGIIPMNQSFPPQQHNQSAPGQPHNINLLSGSHQGMNFPLNAYSSNSPFPNHHLARIRTEDRRREMLAQSHRATGSGAQTGPSVMNGPVPAQPSGVSYQGMAPQNGQGPQRVVTQPVGVGPLPTSHPASHPVNMSNTPLGLTGGLQTQRTGPQSQPQSQMGMRPAQPSLAGQPSVRPASMGVTSMPPMRGPGGTVPSGMIGNVSQQTQPPQGYHTLTVGGPGPQLPSQASQGPATSISQSMHRSLSTPDSANSFSAVPPGFPSDPFSQGAHPHPPPNHIAGPNPPNQFGFMPTPSPSQPMDMGHSLSSGGAGPSGMSPTRSDFTMTPAQYTSMQHGSGVPSGSGGTGRNEGFPTTFATMPPGPSSSSHSALGLPHQQAQTPQGPSLPTPPRQQTPHQQPHMSPAHLSERFSAPIPNPARPQSQPQRPSSQQQMRSSLTPHIPPGTLPPNATLLQGPPTSISGGSAPPPQSRQNIGTTVGAGPTPLTSASSTENGDLSRQPGAPGIRPLMPRSV